MRGDVHIRHRHFGTRGTFKWNSALQDLHQSLVENARVVSSLQPALPPLHLERMRSLCPVGHPKHADG
eukprot:10230804-Karenia_brevis.AAC.1